MKTISNKSVILMMLMVITSPVLLFSQTNVVKSFTITQYKKQELLATKNISISDSIFAVQISSIDNNIKLLDIRNVSFPSQEIRNKYVELSDTLIAKLTMLDELNKKATSTLQGPEKSPDNIKGQNADSVLLKKLQSDTSLLKTSLRDLDKNDFAKIYCFSSSNFTLTSIASFAKTSILAMLNSKDISASYTYIEQSIGELLLSSEIKTIKDSIEDAGQLCVNKYVAIYPTVGNLNGQVHVNSTRKVLSMQRKLKFKKSFYEGTLTNELLANTYTSKLLSDNSASNQKKGSLNAFFKKASLNDIFNSTLLDDSGKRVVSKYISNPDNLKKKHFNFGLNCTVNHRVKKLVQYYGLSQLLDTLVVDHLQIEIRESSLQNITIKGHFKNNPSSLLVFDNRNIPYPLSSQIYLKSARRSVPIQTRAVFVPGSSAVSYSKSYDMNLWDAIQYFPKFQQGSDNLSPEDGVSEIDLKNSESNCITLHRTKTSKLFELKVFNDPLGFQSDVPNGLVQFEVNKKFTTVPRSTKLNGFTFVEPKFVWSKIEDKSNLSFSQVVDSGIPQATISAIDLVRYSKLQLDLKANGITLALPAASMIIYLNAGAGIYQTRITDSVYTSTFNGDSLNPEFIRNIKEIKSTNVNTLNYYTDIDIRFRPDNRYNLLLNFKIGRFNPLNANYEFSGIQRAGLQIFNYYSSSLEGSASYNGNRYFIRGVYTSNLEDSKNNFFQLQIGIAKTLFKTNN